MKKQNCNISEKLLIIPFFIIVFITGYYLGINNNEQGAKVEEPIDIEELSLMIDFQDGNVLSIADIELETPETVFSLLDRMSQKNGFTLEFKEFGSDLGVFIESINGYENDFSNDRYWQFWVNGEYAKVGASLMPLEAGDVVEWKFIKGQVE